VCVFDRFSCDANTHNDPYFQSPAALPQVIGWLWIHARHARLMLIGIAPSVTGAGIRLTVTQWEHIATHHVELSGLQNQVLQCVAMPERIVAGNAGELLALKQQPSGKTLVVVYREEGDDGFVITAFLTRRLVSLLKRKQIWP
jgi:hypothetical protein